MWCKILAAPVLVALFCVPSAMAQCGDQSPHPFVVVNVNLEPEGHLSPAQQASVKLRVIGRCFDSPDAHEMAQQVLDAYQNFGYFRAAVSDPALKFVDDTRYPKLVSLTFDVDEGPQFTVDSVIWHGVDVFPDDQVWQLTSMKPGEVVDMSKVRETVEGVQRLYVSSGFAEAVIVSRVEVPVSRRVQVHFTVMHGRPSDRSPRN